MRILFISDNFPPEVNAPATRTYEHCKEWVKMGAKVTVITCAPNFPMGKVYEGYKNKLYQKEFMDGIEVRRVWTYITANRGFGKRILDYASFMVSSFIAGVFVKSDIIIATSPQFFTTWSAYALSVVKRKPWIFELRDLWPASIRTVGATKSSLLIRILEKIELFLYKKAKMVIAVTDAFKEDLVRRGIDPKKIHVVTNGSNLDLFRPREKDVRLLESLSLNNKFVVAYIGTHGMAHGLDFIIRSLKKLVDNTIHFIFVGDGACREEIESIARANKLKNVTFFGQIPKEKVPQFMAISDATLIPLKRSEIFKTVIPSKIFEAASMRKPILLGVDGEARKLVEKYNAGLYYEPENERDFLEKVIMLKKDVELYKELQRGCGHLAQAYDRTRLARLMYNYLGEAVN